jgi:ribose-phosphate pyrophosphokinase
MIKVNGIEIKQGRFPDNTLLMKFDPNGDDFSYDRGAIEVEWLYENDAELFALICVKRHLDRHFTNPSVVLSMPYIPHARMDRVKSDEDVFTLKYFCEVINSLHFDIVWVRDAHSNVSLALLENVQEMPIVSDVLDAIFLSKADALFFPDEGAMKRYSGEFDIPYAFGMKKRDWKTGQIQGLDIINAEVVKDKNILIVDDICSRGGTFYHSAKALKAAGAKSVSLYVTHCEKTIVLGEMASTDGLVDHVYTTKSIFPDYLFEEGNYDPYWREWITILD